MSFAPIKNRKQQSRDKKGQEDIKQADENGSQRDDNGSKANLSIRSNTDYGTNERFLQMASDIARLQQQQDSYTHLLGMKGDIENLKKDQKTLQSVVKRVQQIEDRISDFEQRFDDYQRKTEQFLIVLDKNIDEESSIREDENKKIKKVCGELERRQKEMDYEVKMDIKQTSLKANQDMLQVTADIDKKVDGYKEFLENHIDAVHRSLKSELVDDEDRINQLSEKLDQADAKLDSRVLRIEESMLPTIDSANKRRKIDYADLKAWLLDSIDERMKQKEQSLEKTVKKNYKSTVFHQKTEINDLKREVTQLASVSPVKGRASAIEMEEHFESIDERYDNYPLASGNPDQDHSEGRKSGNLKTIII